MRRPWQIWLLYVLSLAVVVPAMAWLTVMACRLDEAEAAARRQAVAARLQAERARGREESARQRAELEEDVSLALWRMDTWLAPLIAQEAARPYFVYRPFYALPVKPKSGKGDPAGVTQQPSPLLMQPSEYVLLNFQVAPENIVTSPQAPAEHLNTLAIANGATNNNIDISNKRVVQLKEQIDHQQLRAQLPEQTLPRVELDDFAWNSRLSLPVNSPGQTAGSPNANEPAFSQIDAQQIEQTPIVQQQAQPAPQQEVAQLAPPSQPEQQASAPQSGGQRYNVSRDQRTQMMRGGTEFLRRNRAFQNYAQQALSQQRQGIPEFLATTVVSEGVSRPLWLGPHLVLARRMSVGEQEYVQGAWLDWDKIRATLLNEIADLLPDADLVRVAGDAEVNPARMLAALPVRLVVPDPVVLSSVGSIVQDGSELHVSPIRVSLWIAWACMALAAIAVAVLLTGVLSLSERRAAFVAAVTHELRTPLTTFRMYAEMLSEGMITDEHKRQSYLTTLRAEAERLTHLVGNVLAYARLERGRLGGRREEIALSELVDRVLSRLSDRAQQAEMTLVAKTEPEALACAVRSDPAAIEQILFNLVDNACKYAVAADDKRIHMDIAVRRGGAQFTVRDHGPGISHKAARRLFKPFSKSVHDAANTAPGVGLGLALSRRLARELGGHLDTRPGKGEGAVFVLTLPVLAGPDYS